MVFTMPRVSGDLERRGEEGGREGRRDSEWSVIPASLPASQSAVDATPPHRHIVLVAWPQFGVAVLLDIETGHRRHSFRRNSSS